MMATMTMMLNRLLGSSRQPHAEAPVNGMFQDVPVTRKKSFAKWPRE